MTENNTYAQTMIDRSRNDRRILFEKRRPPIFTTTPPLSPDQISFVLSSFVAETIRKCKPLVKGSDFIDEDVIVLGMPEDAHLIPLLEHQLPAIQGCAAMLIGQLKLKDAKADLERLKANGSIKKQA